jgi:hypothetical protein
MDCGTSLSGKEEMLEVVYIPPSTVCHKSSVCPTKRRVSTVKLAWLITGDSNGEGFKMRWILFWCFALRPHPRDSDREGFRMRWIGR